MASIEIFAHDPNVTTVRDGERIFAEGDQGTVMYAVLEGAVELTIGGRTVETVAPGDIFGEMALIDHKTRSASAAARGDSSIVPIDERRFLYLVQNTPHFALEVMRTMARRLRIMDEKF